MFFKYQNIFNTEDLIVYVLIIIFFIATIDHILIKNHPKIINLSNNTDDEYDDIFDDEELEFDKHTNDEQYN